MTSPSRPLLPLSLSLHLEQHSRAFAFFLCTHRAACIYGPGLDCTHRTSWPAADLLSRAVHNPAQRGSLAPDQFIFVWTTPNKLGTLHAHSTSPAAVHPLLLLFFLRESKFLRHKRNCFLSPPSSTSTSNESIHHGKKSGPTKFGLVVMNDGGLTWQLRLIRFSTRRNRKRKGEILFLFSFFYDD